eukprot:5666558-Pyramimonas_sp.AAC.1
MRRTVAFQFTGAYRRDYEWGKFFREQWRSNLPGSAWRDGGSCFTEDSCSLLGTGNPASVQFFEYFGAGSEDRYFGWQIKLAVGRSYFKLD